MTSIVPRVSSMAETCWLLAVSWPRASPARSWDSRVSFLANSSMGLAMVPENTQATKNPTTRITAEKTTTVRVLVRISSSIDCRENPAANVPMILPFERMGSSTYKSSPRRSTRVTSEVSSSSPPAGRRISLWRKYTDPSALSTTT